MRTLRVAIVDDEPLARVRLRRLLERMPAVQVEGEYAGGRELVAGWHLQPADVVLLDVQMPDLDGFGALDRLVPRPRVVFVTAHAGHAIRAFDVAATDFVLKPVSGERLAAAVERARAAATPGPAPAPLAAAADPRLALPLGRKLQLVDPAVIEWVRAQANYIEIRGDGRTWVMRRPMAWIESRLDPQRFLRVHRSWLVRVDAVREVVPLASGRHRLRLADGTTLAAGRGQRDRVRQAFGLRVDDAAR